MKWFRRREEDLDEEIRAHIAIALADRIRAGEDPKLARAAVLKEFGGVALKMEDTRTVWRWRRADEAMRDLRFAARTMARTPGFTAAAILSLALGIGATTALFSVLDHVAWQPLPYKDPARLAMVWSTDPRVATLRTPASFPDWRDWRAADGFKGLAAFRNRPGFLVTSGDAVQVELHEVSADFLPLLVAPAALGALWSEAESATSAPVAISYHLWQTAFGASRDTIGRRVVISQTPYRIAAVMPRGFNSPSVAAQTAIRLSPADSVWAPLVPGPVQRNNRGNRGLRILARMAPGATFEQGQRNLAMVAGRLAAAYPESNRGLGVQVSPLVDAVTGDVRPALAALGLAAGLFLVIACANVASLLLARGSARRREFATRMALGAARGRLIRQLLTESLMLAAAGGLAGTVLAAVALAFARSASAVLDIPRLSESVMDLPVLGVSLAVTMAAGLLFGILPALRVTRLDTQRGTADLRGVRIRQILIAGVTALTLVLVFSATLLMASFQRLTANRARAAERTYTFQTTLSGTRWTRTPLDRQFYDSLLDRLRRLPQVEAVGVTTRFLQIGDVSSTLFTAMDAPPLPPDRQPLAGYTMADAAFFGLAGIPLLQGRLFEARDRADAPLVAVVNQAFVRAVSSDQPLLGRKVKGLGIADAPFEIVGMVADSRPFRAAEQDRPRLFYPYSQSASTRFIAVVRMREGAAPPMPAIRKLMRELDPALPVFEMKSVTELLGRATSASRWGSTLVACFAAVALLLAGIGVMGVAGFVASQRTKECGIRLALGAAPGSVQWLIARQGLLPAAAGLAVGAMAMPGVAHLLSGYLFEISPGDPRVLFGDAVLLIASAVLAVLIPARRATGIDPASTLRCD